MVVRFDTPVTTFVSFFADSLSTLVSMFILVFLFEAPAYLILSLFEALTDCNGSFFSSLPGCLVTSGFICCALFSKIVNTSFSIISYL